MWYARHIHAGEPEDEIAGLEANLSTGSSERILRSAAALACGNLWKSRGPGRRISESRRLLSQ